MFFIITAISRSYPDIAVNLNDSLPFCVGLTFNVIFAIRYVLRSSEDL